MFTVLTNILSGVAMLVIFTAAIYLFYLAIYECLLDYFIYSAALDLLCCNAIFKNNMVYCSTAVYISLAIIAIVACTCMCIKKHKAKEKRTN